VLTGDEAKPGGGGKDFHLALLRVSLSFVVLREDTRYTLSSPPLSSTSFGSVAVVGNDQ